MLFTLPVLYLQVYPPPEAVAYAPSFLRNAHVATCPLAFPTLTTTAPVIKKSTVSEHPAGLCEITMFEIKHIKI